MAYMQRSGRVGRYLFKKNALPLPAVALPVVGILGERGTLPGGGGFADTKIDKPGGGRGDRFNGFFWGDTGGDGGGDLRRRLVQNAGKDHGGIGGKIAMLRVAAFNAQGVLPQLVRRDPANFFYGTVQVFFKVRFQHKNSPVGWRVRSAGLHGVNSQKPADNIDAGYGINFRQPAAECPLRGAVAGCGQHQLFAQ